MHILQGGGPNSTSSGGGVRWGGGGDMAFSLDLHLPFCLALLCLYLLWLLRLTLPYPTPVAQYDSVAIFISIICGPVRDLLKNIIIFFTSRPDSAD